MVSVYKQGKKLARMVTTSTGQEFNVVEQPISKAEESEDATYWDEKRMGTIRRAFSRNFRPFRSTYACLQLHSRWDVGALRYSLEEMEEEDRFSQALVPIYIDEVNSSFFQVRVRLFTSLSDNGKDTDDAFRR